MNFTKLNFLKLKEPKRVVAPILKYTFLVLFSIMISCDGKETNMDEKYWDKVQTMDSTILSFYAAISADNGKQHDWDLYRYVMHPEAKLIAYEPDKTTGEYKLVYYSADSYIKRYKKYMTNSGFFEREIFRKVESFGPIHQVLSGYASYERGMEKPMIRGVNTFQLLNDGERWWIINALYTREAEGYMIPELYLNKYEEKGAK